MTKHKPVLSQTEKGWQVSDGINTGSGSTIESANQAYKDCLAESNAFRPQISQDTAYELLNSLHKIKKCAGKEGNYYIEDIARDAIKKARG